MKIEINITPDTGIKAHLRRLLNDANRDMLLVQRVNSKALRRCMEKTIQDTLKARVGQLIREAA